jgi:hypothetical protein
MPSPARIPGVPSRSTVEVKTTEDERSEFVEAAKKAGFLRTGTQVGAAGAWLRSLGLDAIRQGRQ